MMKVMWNITYWFMHVVRTYRGSWSDRIVILIVTFRGPSSDRLVVLIVTLQQGVYIDVCFSRYI